MRWVAQTERDAANDALEKRLWDAADKFRANSGLTSAQYSTPVLGLQPTCSFKYPLEEIES